MTATGGNNAQGDISPTGGLDFYCHDVTVQDDPKTGTPTVYLHYWDAGLMIFDASDPTDLEQVGLFPMFQAHFAVPAPDTITDADGNERRVAFASHEEPDVSPAGRDGKPNPGSSGTVYLVDTDDIYAKDGVVECGELASYTWQEGSDNPDAGVDFANFELSPHNSDPGIYRTEDGDRELWLHQGHYNGGTRFLKVLPGADCGTTITDGESPVIGEAGEFVTAPDIWEAGPTDRPNDATDWRFGEPDRLERTDGNVYADPDAEDRTPVLFEDGTPIGDYIRPVRSVPDDSKMDGLSPAQPFHWAAVQSRGITFASDINQGVFAAKHDDIPLKGPIPFVDVDREEDTSIFIGDRAGRVEIDVRETDKEVLIRDRAPSEFSIFDSDAHETYPLGGQTAVEFSTTATTGDELRYLIESPGDLDDTGTYVFGPVEFSDDGGDTWHALSDTLSTPAVLGADPTSSDAVALGTAAGLTGYTYTHREKLRERIDDILGDDE